MNEEKEAEQDTVGTEGSEEGINAEGVDDDKTQENEKEHEAPEAPENEAGEEEPDLRQVLLPSDVYTLAQFTISLLGNAAWQHLGLVADPQTGEVKKDLAQAQLSIDIISFLFDKIKHTLEKEQEREVRNLLTNLTMNYVEKSREGQGKPPEGDG